MLATEAIMKYATKPNVTEQVACLETALRAIAKLRLETPAQMLQIDVSTSVK